MPLARLIRAPLGRARRKMRGLREYLYDFQQFAAASGAVPRQPLPATRLALLVKEYHKIEKGLALPAPRPGFGAATIAKVMELVAEVEQSGERTPHTAAARSALEAYRRFAGCPPELDAAIAAFNKGHDPAGWPEAGSRLVTKDAIRQASAIEFGAFAAARHSVRDFTGELLSPDAIRAAIAIAMKSPRVCNRGTARCHAILDRDGMTRALALQNGNAGFGDSAGAVLVITSDRRGFLGWGERNQCWIDGGLFAMSLVYALHAAGYGTCMLNWSVLSEQDQKLRSVLGIAEEEAILTMMAVGFLKPEFRVAVSPREPVETALRIVGTGGA